MKFTPSKLNRFTFFKLPAAWWCGVRVISLEESKCVVGVRHRWINQNPFRSMFWAVQGMAAELSTGVLIMNSIQQSDKKASMLLINTKGNFTKKARGKITFICTAGQEVRTTLQTLFEKKGSTTFWLQSNGMDENGDTVATFDFEWSILIKE